MPPMEVKQIGKPKNTKLTIKELAYYYRNYKKIFIVAIVLALIGGVASVAGILFNGIVYSEYIIPSMFFKVTGQTNYALFGLVTFVWWCAGVIVSYAIMTGFGWIESYLLLRLSEGGGYNLRDAIFKKLNRMPISYFDRTPSGDIMSRAINDANNIGDALSQYLGNIVLYIFMIVAMLIMMFLVNPVLACLAILIIPLFIVINVFIMKAVRPFFGKQQKSIGQINGFIEERISGLKIISLFKMKEKSQAQFDEINKKLTKNSIVAQASTNMLMPINIFMNNISFVLIATIGIYGMFKGGHNNQGWIDPNWGVFHFKVPNYVPSEFADIVRKSTLLIVFTLFMRNLNNPIGQLTASLGSIFLALASAERVLDVLKQPNEEDDSDAKDLKEVYGLVEAEDLDFSYVDNKPVLKKINFFVKPGQTVALVGPTGAGKTTIVNLITKFYDISGGDLKIDGMSIKKIKRESLRKNITMVLQDTYLFGNSIYENIRYGRLNATKSEIIKAAKMAHAHNFIMQLPKGYNTVLEDNGSNLSQGQRQLLAIARAFLSNSKIVILDEATSSIDTKTEIEIQAAMNDLMKDRTSFVIAHRLSTIKNANMIFVINEGRIVERGKHDELLKTKGFYAKLYNSQFKGKQI